MLELEAEDLLAVERELCRSSFASFIKRAWPVLEPGKTLAWGWCLDAMAEHLEAVTAGQIKRLLINVPPGTMKSLMVGVLWPAWEWGPLDRQELRYVGTAHSQDLAIRDSMKCRRLIQCEWYQALWPVKLTSDQNAKTKFENSRTGFRQATSFEGITGYRGDRVLLDDPHSVADANSAALLEAELTLFGEALPSRTNDSESAIVIGMQRLNPEDISQAALDLGYEHLCIPMRWEPGRSKHVVGMGDPRKEEGALMFPERFPEDSVQILERALGSYGCAAQLQQRPHPRGGGLIKTEWYGWYRESAPQLEWRCIIADTAQKTGVHNDFSVLQCWGRSITGKAVLITQKRGKWEEPELLDQSRKFWFEMLGEGQAPLRAMYVEDKVSGTAIIQTLRREGITVLPIQRNRDKYSRARDACPFLEAGNVLLPEWAPWIEDFVKESESFTGLKSNLHDDQLDPMFDMIRLIQSDNTPMQQYSGPVYRKLFWKK